MTGEGTVTQFGCGSVHYLTRPGQNAERVTCRRQRQHGGDHSGSTYDRGSITWPDVSPYAVTSDLRAGDAPEVATANPWPDGDLDELRGGGPWYQLGRFLQAVGFVLLVTMMLVAPAVVIHAWRVLL